MQVSRWREIADRYVADIQTGRLGPGDRLPSDAALAQICGVSRVTAHKALAELRRLGLVTRNGRNGTVVSAQERTPTGRVALVLDQIALHRDFPRADLLGGIHEGLGELTDLLWCDSKLDPERERDLLRRMPNETDGILCWPTGHAKSNAVLNELVARHVPLVLLDRVPKDVRAHAVVSDSSGATRHALSHLIERGHRRIGLLSFDKPNVSTVAERVGGYAEVMEANGISTIDLYRRFPAALEFSDAEFFSQAVYDAVFTLVKSPTPVTALFCIQDMLCAAAVDAVSRIGLSIPEDLEIVAFNDWPLHMLHRPWQVHRIHTRASEIGRVAAQVLLRQINGDVSEPSVTRVTSNFVLADAGIHPLSSDLTYR